MSPDEVLAVSLARYLPARLVERVGRDPRERAWGERIEAATFFADVCGFTQIAESLASAGIVGAERLGARLNATFGAIIELIVASGGEIIAFPGDAVVAIWPSDASEALPEATLRAADVALAVQRWAGGAPEALELRIGIGAGTVWWGSVGGVEDRWKVCVGGPELALAGRAASVASPGSVATTPAAAQALRRSLDAPVLTELAGGWNLVGPGAIPVEPPPRVPRGEPLTPDLLRAFVPRPVLIELEAGHDDWVAEFRGTTIVFVNVQGIDFLAPDIGENLKAIVRATQEEVYRYGGSLNQLVSDEKGLTLLAVWGVPGSTHEDDGRRAVEAAIALRQRLTERSHVTSIGIATGRTFCGVRGSVRRREYAVIGARVNLAARLMQVGADILVDEATAEVARDRFGFEGPVRLLLKGQAKVTLAYRPTKKSERAVRAPARLFGREGERATIAGILGALEKGGPGTTLVIEGEAGIGKSWLLGDLVSSANRARIPVFAGAADSMKALSPYFAWRAVLAAVFGGRSPSVADLRALAPDLDPTRLPFLSPLLDVEIPDTEHTRHVTGAGRVEVTSELVCEILRARLADPRAVLVVEDVHWLDSASWAMARAVRRGLPGVLLVLTTRPISGEALPRESRELLRDPSLVCLSLGPLDEASIRCLIEASLSVASLPPQVLDFLRERGRGHPLISEQLTLALRDAGFLSVVGSRCRVSTNAPDLSDVGLPRDVEGAIARRIDELSPLERLTMKVASVVGFRFDARTLSAVFPVDQPKDALAGVLDSMVAAKLLDREGPEPLAGYVFKHALTRDGVYTRLSYAQRRELHARIGLYLESSGARDPALLAHHFHGAEIDGKACHYAERAGLDALRSGANREAAEYYGRALTLSERLSEGDAGAPRRAVLACNLGVALYGLGNLSESRRRLTDALQLAGIPTPGSPAGWLSELVRQAASQISLRAVPRIGSRSNLDPEALATVALAAQRLSENFLWDQSSLPMVACTLLSVNAAERGHRLDGSARSYAMLGFSLGMSRAYGLAEAYFARAEAAATTCNDLAGRVFVGYSRGVFLIGVGRWAESRASIETAMPLSRALGDPQEIEMTETSLANLEFVTGAFELSADRYRDIAASGRRRANVQHEAWGLYGEGRSLIPLGKTELAEQRLRDALAMFQDAPEPVSEHICHGLLAELCAARGDWDEARKHAATATTYSRRGPPTVFATLYGYAGTAKVQLQWLARRQRAGEDTTDARADALRACRYLRTYSLLFPIGWPRAHLSAGCYEWLLGRRRAAARSFEKSLAAARRLAMPYEEALAHQHLALIAKDANVAGEHRKKMDELMTTLRAVEPMELLERTR